MTTRVQRTKLGFGLPGRLIAAAAAALACGAFAGTAWAQAVAWDSTTGTISVSGTANADHIEITDDGTYIDITINGAPSNNVAPSASVNLIDVAGGGGADTIDCATLNTPCRINGGEGDDTLKGGGGNDTLIGGAGNDTIDGDGGTDTVSYSTSSSAVTVSLALQGTPQDTVGAGTDTITNCESLTGGAGNDILAGDANANTIGGGNGNDVIAGGAGNDTLLGGPGDDTIAGDDGTDTADYGSATAAVTVDLGVATAQNTAGAGTDTLAGCENLTGGAGNDTLTGDTNANVLSGGEGNDTLNGRAGNDTLNGGNGTDTADYRNGALASVSVNLSAGTANDGDGGTDALAAIENYLVPPSQLVANAGPDRVIVTGDSTTLAGSAGGGNPPYAYAWTPAENLSSTTVAQPTANPTASKTYTLTVTDFLSQTAVDTVVVTVNSALTASAGGDKSIVSGASTVLNGLAQGGIPPYTYLWQPSTGLSATNVATPTASPTKTTTYIFGVQDSAAHTASDAVVVTVTAPPDDSGNDGVGDQTPTGLCGAAVVEGALFAALGLLLMTLRRR